MPLFNYVLMRGCAMQDFFSGCGKGPWLGIFVPMLRVFVGWFAFSESCFFIFMFLLMVVIN